MDIGDLMGKQYYYYSFRSLVAIHLLCIVLYMGMIYLIEYYRFNRLSGIFSEKTEENNRNDKDLEKAINSDDTMLGNSFFQIRDLNKHFGELHAVKDFNCDFQAGKLFVLLGHNGAGKSTLINMVAGVHEPSSGGIFLNGENMVHNRQLLYQNLGLCDQEDVFYENFTVEENLFLMQGLKGGNEDPVEINDYLNILKMNDKLCCRANELSGGQKRKLCLAMSLIGKSKLVILDEPTSGMDVFARKDVWTLLKKVKQERCIILTTHSMDEAELVSDEIGIMAEGELIERGMAFELKNKIGNEFTLTIIKKYPKTVTKHQINQHQEELFIKVRSVCNESKLKINSKEVLKITVNCNEEVAATLFQTLDGLQQEGKIDDYSYSSVTLEDFFLSTNKQAENKASHISSLSTIETGENGVNIFKEVFLNIRFRFFSLIRDYQTFLLNLIVGLVFLNGFTFILESNNFGTPSSSSADTFNSNIKLAYLTHPSLSSQQVASFIPLEVSRTQLTPQSLNSPEEFRSYLIEQNFHRNDYHMIVYFKSAREAGVEAFLMQNKMLSISATEFLMRANAKFNTRILKSSYDYFNGESQSTNKIIQLTISISFGFVFLFSFLRLIISSIRSIVYERVQNIKHIQNMYGIRSLTYWIGIFIIDMVKFSIFLLCGWNLFKWFGISIEDMLMLISVLAVTLLVYYYALSNLFSDYTWVETGLTIYSMVVIYIVPNIYMLSASLSGIKDEDDLFAPTYSPFLLFPEMNFILHIIKLPMFCVKQCLYDKKFRRIQRTGAKLNLPLPHFSRNFLYFPCFD